MESLATDNECSILNYKEVCAALNNHYAATINLFHKIYTGPPSPLLNPLPKLCQDPVSFYN